MQAVKLRVLKNGEELQVLDLAELGKSSVVLGRAETADVRMDDRAIGRNHAVISLGGPGISVQKKTEFGKLHVNGAEVNESQLKPGDVISIADYQVRLEQAEKASESRESKESGVGQASTSEAVQPAGVGSHPDFALLPEEKTPPQGTNLNSDAPMAMADSLEMPALGVSPPAAAGEAGSGGEAGFVETEKTAMVPVSQLAVKLVFKPGEANVEEFEIKDSEITIGRGTACAVTLEDKRASREHVVIKKAGGAYLIKDLDSANGTFVNGIKINEQELSGDDVIKIGNTEFVFKALNQDYINQEQKGDFLVVSPDAPGSESEADVAFDQNAGMELEAVAMPGMENAGFMASQAQPPFMGAHAANASMDGINGMNPGFGAGAAASPIPGLAAPAPRQSLISKFMALPPRKRIIYGGVIFVIIIGLMDLVNEQDAAEKAAALAKKKAEQSQSKDPNELAFNQLPKEKQEFIKQTYALSLDLYTKKNYEQALFEINKIAEILPNFAYKDSKDIAEYARRGLEMIRAQQEEQRKREEEDKRKQKIAELVASAQELFDKGMEVEAKEIFSRILELDPDNPTVARLKATIEEREQKKRLEEEQRRQIEQMKRLMTDILNAGKDLLKDGKYYEAIDKFLEVPGVGTDAALINEAKELIAAAKKELADRRQPHLNAGKAAYENKEYEKSRDEFRKALDIDPKCEECRDGIALIKHDVHERAQKIYIEAIIAESVSDLTSAKKKYLECYQSSVPEDDYYGRCWRKYHRFITLEAQPDHNATAGGIGGVDESKAVRAPAESLRDMDPYTQEVLESL